MKDGGDGGDARVRVEPTSQARVASAVIGSVRGDVSNAYMLTQGHRTHLYTSDLPGGIPHSVMPVVPS